MQGLPGRSVRLGDRLVTVAPIGFGAFKIGRNQSIKYPHGYNLPSEAEAAQILEGVLELGINWIDTAPAYGCSEARIGRYLHGRRDEFVLSTKVGETFDGGRSHYDFSRAAVEESVERSLRRLQTDVLDVVFVHSDGRDELIQQQTDIVETLQDLKRAGATRAIGFSGKTVAGARRALDWADVLMVAYNAADRSHESVIAEAGRRGIPVVVKKGLASGHLPPEQAIRFVLRHPDVTLVVVGSLSLGHLRDNLRVAVEALARRPPSGERHAP